MIKGTRLPDFLDSTTEIELTKLILSLTEGCKTIARLVNNAGISGIIGVTGTSNIHGESVQKLDDLSNQILMDYLTASHSCAGYLSEENDDIVTLDKEAKYIISVDPLDGSSNTDVCAPIGTIFAVSERLTKAGVDVQPKDFLQKGIHTKAAGYLIYGSSTILILSTGKGVNGFTLSTADYEFYLSHPDIKTPADGKIYSINLGNTQKFDDGVKNFVDFCETIDKNTSRPYSLRYIGSMVGDLHRNLIKGGIFIYPANKGETKGKLRLLYECIPMAFIIEDAGGKATDGTKRILELKPEAVHERCAIFIGSKNMIDKALEFLQ